MVVKERNPLLDAVGIEFFIIIVERRWAPKGMPFASKAY